MLPFELAAERCSQLVAARHSPPPLMWSGILLVYRQNQNFLGRCVVITGLCAELRGRGRLDTSKYDEPVYDNNY